jgi:8-oxo-dGTP pyrophosphatase MutT (NUDIX family)
MVFVLEKYSGMGSTGLVREIREETGLAIAVADAFYAFTYINHVKGSQGIEVVYFAQFVDPIENIRLSPEDHSGYAWVSEDELEKATAVRDAHDQEVLAIRKGFALLRGGSLKVR